MKPRFLGLLAVALLAGATGAMAQTTCPTGSFDQYLSVGFTCTTQGLMFSDFSFAGSATGGAAAPAAAANNVSILFDAPGFMTGFEFDPAMLAMSGQSQQETISFEVTGVGPIRVLGGATFGFGSGDIFQTVTVSADGQTISNSGPFLSFGFPCPSNLADGCTSLFFTDTVTVGDGALSGSLTALRTEFNRLIPAPEPATLALLVLGLAGVGFMNRRNKKPTAV